MSKENLKLVLAWSIYVSPAVAAILFIILILGFFKTIGIVLCLAAGILAWLWASDYVEHNYWK